uniref:Uncharacterized protein n=1 Tax=Noctiluca scintillans TaxID=2966 RepID=A0A7S1AN80_NOCSC|mmetsp:Transcript_53251/g.142498  ORF Transcript_53251/g.142498 Transcript_53251/m.142498 type:complete len:425 (+) Transcript_53251:53-1327(+)
MVLLARCAQERFAKHESEGIESGRRVSVLSGRQFPLFGAGDTGVVLRVDKEALNCDVLFDGGVQPIPVALRHLKLEPDAVVVSGHDEGVCAESTGPPSRLRPSVEDVWCVAMEQAEDSMHSLHEAAQASGVELALPGRTDHGALACDFQVPPSGCDSDAVRCGCRGTILELEQRLALMEQRHRTEIELLRRQLQESAAYGQQQESKVASLELHIQSLAAQHTHRAQSGTQTSYVAPSMVPPLAFEVQHLPSHGDAQPCFGTGHSVCSGRVTPRAPATPPAAPRNTESSPKVTTTLSPITSPSLITTPRRNGTAVREPVSALRASLSAPSRPSSVPARQVFLVAKPGVPAHSHPEGLLGSGFLRPSPSRPSSVPATPRQKFLVAKPGVLSGTPSVAPYPACPPCPQWAPESLSQCRIPPFVGLAK